MCTYHLETNPGGWQGGGLDRCDFCELSGKPEHAPEFEDYLLKIPLHKGLLKLFNVHQNH